MKRTLLIVTTILMLSLGPASVDVLAYPPPTDNVNASDGTYVNEVWITWDPTPGALWYEVCRYTETGGGKTTLGQTSAFFFHDTTAPHDAIWLYRVYSCNNDFVQCASDPDSTDTGYAGLATPTSVDASDGVYYNRICVSWNGVSGATGYDIRVGDDPNYYFDTVSVTGTSHCFEGLDRGTLYYFWVRATNSVDESDFSSPYETGYEKLSKPGNVQATDGDWCDKTRVTWDPVEGARYHRVTRGLPGGTHDTAWHVTGWSYFNDTTGTADTIYEYSVFGCADVGCGESNSDEGFTAGPVSAPGWIDASDGLYTDMIRIEWEEVPGAWEYNIRGESDMGTVDIVGVKDTSYDYYLAEQGVTYHFRVSARNACGEGPRGDYDDGWLKPGPTPTITSTPTEAPKPSITPTSTESPRPSITPTPDPTVTPTRTKSTPTPTSTATPEHGPWDGDRISAPRVIHDTSGYRMWYDGYNEVASEWGVGLARSLDNCTWWKHGGNPVLRPGSHAAWDGGGRMQVSVYKGSSLYKMWFSANDGMYWQTGYATSPDGIVWNVYSGNPVLRVGASGAWDELEANAPAVIKEAGVYKMWYHGCTEGYGTCAIGYAISPDGKNWTKHAENPVLEGGTGEWDEGMAASPAVIRNGSSYEMWYWGMGGIGRATSHDGTQWTKDASNPVLTEGWNGMSVGQPFVLLEGGTYRMWLRQGLPSDSSIGYAESSDGIHWTLSPCNPALIPGYMPGLWLPMVMRG